MNIKITTVFSVPLCLLAAACGGGDDSAAATGPVSPSQVQANAAANFTCTAL